MSIRPLYRFAQAITCLLLISGCTTYRYVPAATEANPQETVNTAPVALRIDSPVASREAHQPNTPEWQKMKPALEKAVADNLKDLSSHPVSAPSPTLSVSVDNDGSQMHWGSFFLYIVTLTLVPATDDLQFESHMAVKSGEKTLFTSREKGEMRRYLSVYFPTPLFIGKSDPAVASQDMTQAMMARHRQALDQWMTAEKQQYDQQVAGKSMLEQRQWLIDNPDSLFAGDILANLAAHTPRRNTLGWHRENVALFPGYISLLPEEDALWFVGPEDRRVIDLVDAIKRGKNQTILAASVETQGPYKVFAEEEVRRLRKMGLSSDLIAAMIRSTSQTPPQATPAPAVAVTPTPSREETLAALLIPDNSGEYMNPWTSDGVLAEWVDKAINAKMGSAVGSAAGAYAASKALDNVPFVGGFLGSKVGKKMGHSAAISASGGMDYIRQTSDQSFRSLEDMARYLKAVHGTNSNFQDAIKAADAIYPGLMQSLASAQ